jgi:hypothetical protein
MNDESRSPSKRSRRSSGDYESLPDRFVAAILLLLAVACVGGYFLVMKLIDVSREEDCMLAGRRNCAPVTVPSGR